MHCWGRSTLDSRWLVRRFRKTRVACTVVTLFADVVLLHASGMQNHPLTPMRDANLMRLLSRQTDGAVGFVPYPVVEQGCAAIRDAMVALTEKRGRYAIIDAVGDPALIAIGGAAATHSLITGGSGVAMGLPANFR